MGISPELIKRINELAALKKQRVLTNEEAKEQKHLREEYLKGLDVDLVKNASKDLLVGSMTSAKINGNWE